MIHLFICKVTSATLVIDATDIDTAWVILGRLVKDSSIWQFSESEPYDN